MTQEYFIHLPAEEAIERIAQRVASLLFTASKPPPLDQSIKKQSRIMGKKEVGKLFNVSQTTLTSWMKEGRIPFHRMGRRVYFFEEEVIASLDKPKFVKSI